MHQPIDEANAGATVTFDAMIKHISGIGSATLFWREQGDTNYQEAAMSFVNDDNWTVDLTMPNTAGNVEYYIEAEANSGKVLSRPIVAPEGYWSINVGSLSNSEWAEKHISAAYPNPTMDVVNFHLDQINGPVSVQINNLLGQQLFSSELQAANGVISLNLNASWKGTLFVSFEGEFGRVVRKVIKL